MKAVDIFEPFAHLIQKVEEEAIHAIVKMIHMNFYTEEVVPAKFPQLNPVGNITSAIKRLLIIISSQKHWDLVFDNFGLGYDNPDFIKYAESGGGKGFRPKSNLGLLKIVKN